MGNQESFISNPDYQNFYCQGTFGKCTEDIGFINWKNKQKIGEGSYGIVYKYDVNYKGNDIIVAVKEVYIENNQLENLTKEVYLNYYMSNVDLAPKFYYAFYNTSKQYFIMESMDMNCSKFFITYGKWDTRHEDNLIKQKVVYDMIDILKKQIFTYKLYCSDTKSENFLINNSTFKVKIIDFGLCEYNKLWENVDKSDQENLFYFIQLLQLKITMSKKDFITDESIIFIPINQDDIFKNACYYLDKYENIIFNTVKYYSGNDKSFVYHMANCPLKLTFGRRRINKNKNKHFREIMKNE